MTSAPKVSATSTARAWCCRLARWLVSENPCVDDGGRRLGGGDSRVVRRHRCARRLATQKMGHEEGSDEMTDTKQTEATCWEHCGHQHDELEFSTPRMW